MGIALFLFCFAALAAGLLVKETALIVFALLFILPLCYCLFMCAVLFFIYRRQTAKLKLVFAPDAVPVNADYVNARLYGDISLFTPPAVLFRYMLTAKTLDGRVIQKVFSKKFWTKKNEKTEAGKRGVYFYDDYFFIGDIFGFFNFRIKLKNENNRRLIIYPVENTKNNLSVTYNGSGETEKSAFSLGDNLIEQRKYIPGDDPRRINWKLFGHSGELFVRESDKTGDRRNNLIIVLDTFTNKKEAQNIADELCGKALCFALSARETAAKIVLYYRNRGGANENESWSELVWTPDENGVNEHSLSALRAMFAYPYAVSENRGGRTPVTLRGGENDDVIVIKDE